LFDQIFQAGENRVAQHVKLLKTRFRSLLRIGFGSGVALSERCYCGVLTQTNTCSSFYTVPEGFFYKKLLWLIQKIHSFAPSLQTHGTAKNNFFRKLFRY